MPLHPSVAQLIPRIRELAEEYGVATLDIFGSAMTDTFDPDRSDVDFIVHYPDGYDFGHFVERLFNMESELAEILGHPAQMVMTSALKKDSLRQNANLTRTTIYVANESESTALGYQDPMPTHR